MLRETRFAKAWMYLSRFFGHGFSAVGAIAVVLQMVSFVFPRGLPWSGWPLATSVIVISAIYSLVRTIPRAMETEIASPKTRIKIIKGDLFSQDCHIVVGACDTFDTSTPTIIERSSVQGQTLERLYGGNVEKLDAELQSALAGKKPYATITKQGKTRKYDIGTVATLDHGPRNVYFLAYTEMDEHNEAHATSDGIWRSLSALWQEISRTGNGRPISIPVLGGGQSRISPIVPALDSIRLIVLSYMFASRTKRISNELRIVVQKEDFDRLDRVHLQAFLDSMQRS